MNEEQFFVVDYRDLSDIKIAMFATLDEARLNCPEAGGASVVTSEESLLAFEPAILLAVYNRLQRGGKPLTAFDSQEDGVRRTFLLMQAPQDTVNPTSQQEQPKMATTKKSKRAEKAATKAKKTPAAVKPKKAASSKPNGHDVFGLRTGSGASEAARMFARDNGASMAEVKEKTGANQYNLLKKLKADGHKVKSEEGRFYLTAK